MIPIIAQDTAFAAGSKVWTYVAARPFTDVEQARAQSALDAFTRNWTAHNQELKARAEIVAHQIILLVVDETQAGASGCSIDKSVHFLETLGDDLGVDLFDRMQFGWIDDDGQIRVNSRDQLTKMKESGEISEITPMINTLAATLADLRDRWSIPLHASWHNRII
jgi:hypothetical protein